MFDKNSGSTVQEVINSLISFDVLKDINALVINLESKNELLTDADINHTPILQRDFNELYSVLSDIVAKSELLLNQAKTESEKQYALALLERSDEYFQAKGQKSTDTLRKAYAETDSLYLKAKEEEHKAKAVLTYLQGKLQVAQQGYYSSKRIFEKTMPIAVMKD